MDVWIAFQTDRVRNWDEGAGGQTYALGVFTSADRARAAVEEECARMESRHPALRPISAAWEQQGDRGYLLDAANQLWTVEKHVLNTEA